MSQNPYLSPVTNQYENYTFQKYYCEEKKLRSFDISLKQNYYISFKANDPTNVTFPNADARSFSSAIYNNIYAIMMPRWKELRTDLSIATFVEKDSQQNQA